MFEVVVEPLYVVSGSDKSETEGIYPVKSYTEAKNLCDIYQLTLGNTWKIWIRHKMGEMGEATE